ncbi:MAG: hypothetical protein IH845_05560, partial [Nanoarchaeota archaeon]|nr:hypothetical protein [Nanoarchaeota archaeon]
MKIQKINTNKKGMGGIMSILSIVVIVLLLGVGGYYGFVKDGGMFSFSAGGGPTSGNGAWSEKFVNFDFNAKNQYTGSTVDPSIEVYVEEPISCWNKPRETTCDETSETTATLSSGTVTIKDLKPGHYFAVSRLSSYYPIYVEFDIPNGPQTSTQSLSDYNQAPDSSALKMQEADALTTSNKTFSVSVNTTGKEYTLTDSFTVSDNKCFKLWKISVTEDTNSLTDKVSQV